MVRATLLACGAVASIGMAAHPVNAQYIWTGATTGNFSDASRWQNPQGVPISGASTTLTFAPGNPAAAVTATQNIGTPFQFNGMTFNNMSMPSALTVNNSVGNNFQTAGSSPNLTPTITLQGPGASTITGSSTSVTALDLNSDLRFAGSGMGQLFMSARITETGGPRKLIIANTPPTLSSGGVTLVPGAINTFTGGVDLNGGSLYVGGFFANPLGTGKITVNNSSVLMQVSGSGAWGNSGLELNAQLRVMGTVAPAFLGAVPITGSGALLFNSSTAMNLTTNSSAYTGTVTADRYDLPLALATSGNLQLSGVNGALTGVSTFNIRAGFSLTAQNGSTAATANSDRINNAATINLASGNLQVTGTGTATTTQSDITEVVGTVNAAGYNSIQAANSSGATKSTVLNVHTALNRVDHGTFNFRGSALGAGTLTVSGTNSDGSQNFTGSTVNGSIVVPAAVGAGLAGGGGGAGTPTISILPYAVGDTATTNTGAGTTFVTLDAIGGSTSLNVRPLAIAEYATDLVSGATTNARLVGATANAGVVTVNSLNLASNGILSDGSVTGAGTLNVTSGAILAATTNAATGTSISNNIDFGSAEGNIFTPGLGGLTISGNMTGSNGLTKSGGGSNNNTLFLTGDNSGLTGRLTVNAGVINFNTANALPGSGQIVTNGTNVATTGSAVSLSYSGTSTGVTISRDVAANNGWLAFRTLDSVGTAGTMTLSGQITGAAGISLQTSGAADIFITRTDNTYTGPTMISTGANAFGTGKVHINGDGAFGNGGAVGITGYLMLEGDWTTNRHINNGGMTLDTNGHNATLNGPMTNLNGLPSSSANGGQFNNAALNKAGLGTLTITSNDNALGGPINVNGGRLNVNGTIAGSTTNAVTVNTGATLGGTGTIWRNINVAAGGTLAPGASAGMLTMFGNASLASGSTFEAELNGAAPGLGYDVLAVNGTVNLGGSTLNPVLGFAPAGNEMFFIVINDGTDAITGTFMGLPDMAPITLTYLSNTYNAQISYFADAATGSINGGNDVLIIIPAPATSAGLLAWGTLAVSRRRRR